MRALILVANQPEQGTWFRARRIAEGLRKAGHTVCFVCTGPQYYRARTTEKKRRWQEIQTANWTPIHPDDGHSPLAIIQRLGLVRKKWDLVYTFSHRPADQAPARLIQARGAFWMTDWCDYWNSQNGGLHDHRLWADPPPAFMKGIRGRLVETWFRLEDAYEIAAPRDADAVSVIVRPFRELTRAHHIADRKVLLLPSGADLDRITPTDRVTARTKLGISPADLVAVYLANQSPDTEQLQQALELTWKKVPRLKILSIGPRWYEEGSRIAAARDRGKLIDLGRRPYRDVSDLLAAGDFCLLPMRALPFNECRWPHKMSDYLAAGRAIASTQVGDMGRLIAQHHLGVVGEPTAEGLASAIEKLCVDPVLRRDAGHFARAYAEQRLFWPQIITRLRTFLRKRGLDA